MVRYSQLVLYICTVVLPVRVTCSAWAVPLRADDCASGSESDGNGGCVTCNVGFYRERGNHPECQACPDGWVTRERGAWMVAECDYAVGARGECPSGKEWSSTAEQCVPCPAGTYRTKDVNFWCYKCPPGQNTSLPGAFSIDDCVVPLQCVEGTEWNQTTSFCEPCPRDFFRSHWSGMRCVPCPEGHVTVLRGSNSRKECVPYGRKDLVLNEEDCPAGTEYNAILQVCSVCGVGEYRAASEPFSACRPCPGHTSTAAEGASHPALCMDREQLIAIKSSLPTTGIICPPGTEWFNLEEPYWGRLEGCRPCPWGTYRDQRNQGLCDECPPETSTLMIGAISRDLCLNSSIGDGVYPQKKPLSGKESFSIDNCPPGTSWNITHVACLVCPLGTYSRTGTTCTLCPTNTTTLWRGATTVDQCALPRFTTSGAFFTDSDCPLGSEWDSFSRACRPCPRGWFREARETARCASCPQGLTTLNPGSMSKYLCAVSREVPGRIFIGSDGCEPGYTKEANRSFCVPCERATYKSDLGHGPCTPCPLGRDGLPLQTMLRGATDISLCLPTGEVTRVTPSFGPQAGGTLLHVEVDSPIDFRVSSISVGSHPCTLTANYLVDGVVSCVTGAARSLLPPAPVSVRAPGGVLLTSADNFTYRPDPYITRLSRLSTIVSGGLNLTVKGKNLMSVSSPAFLLYKTRPSLTGADALSWPCEVRTEDEMLCPFPDMSELLAVPPNLPLRRRRYSPGSSQVAPPVAFHTGFALDGVTYFRNLSEVLPQYGTFVIQPDPVLNVFSEKDRLRRLDVGVTQLDMDGQNLNLSLTARDFRVAVGGCQAKVVSLSNELLGTKLCEDLPKDTVHKVNVRMAALSVDVGDVMLVTSVAEPVQSRTGEALQVVIPVLVVAGIVILFVIIIVSVYVYRKRGDKNMDYSPDSSMVATAAQNGHVVDPRLPPLPVNSVFGPERVTVMPGTQGFTTIRSKRDREISMRQLALPPSGGHAGMSVVEAVEIGNQDLLRFELDPEDTEHLSASPVHHHSDTSSVHKDRPGTSGHDTDSAPDSAINSASNSRHSSYKSQDPLISPAPSSTGTAYKARYKSTRTRPLSSEGVASGPRPPTPPPPPGLDDLQRY